jgi:hypothetical protein
MIIAIVALVAALGGTAVGAGGFLKKTKFQNFKKNINSKVDATLQGPLNYVTQTAQVNSTPTNPTKITANCPSGQHPTGGGVKFQDFTTGVTDTIHDQYLTTQGYVANVTTSSATNRTFTVIAACAKVSQTSGSPPSS